MSTEERPALKRYDYYAGPKALNEMWTLKRGGLTLRCTLSTHRLDALLAPAMAPPSPIDLVNGDHGSGGASDSSALAGAPILTFPMGLAHGLPVAVSVWGARGSEPTLYAVGRSLETGRDASTGPLPEPTYVDWI